MHFLQGLREIDASLMQTTKLWRRNSKKMGLDDDGHENNASSTPSYGYLEGEILRKAMDKDGIDFNHVGHFKSLARSVWMATKPSSPSRYELEECHPIASPPSPPLLMSLPRKTNQSLAFITVSGISHPFPAVKNYVFKKVHLIETSGGRLLGVGGGDGSHPRGCRRRQADIIALTCSNNQCAWGIFEALRLKYEFPYDVDYFIADLCDYTRNAMEYPFMEICLYEVRNIQRFNELYMRELPTLVLAHNGHLIAGTSKIALAMGSMTSNFCTISQWKKRAEYHTYCEKGRWYSSSFQKL
nr:expressed conserved protein [Hymenolepis microstoma]